MPVRLKVFLEIEVANKSEGLRQLEALARAAPEGFREEGITIDDEWVDEDLDPM